MCRFVAYLGLPILIEDVLFKTKNSLIHQSMHARESEIVINGDGFGLGWYNHDINPLPGLFKSTQPAWNDENLQHLSAKIRTTCFFGHVRAASTGSVAPHNCHPFAYDNYLFMHNGNVGGFDKIKRYIRRELCDELYDWIVGDTDSEHLAALYFDTMLKNKDTRTSMLLADIMDETIRRLHKIQVAHGVDDEPNFFNIVISNGHNLVAMRYVSDKECRPSSLHYAAGSRYDAHGSGYRMLPTEKGHRHNSVLVVSERLDSHKGDWHEIASNHYLILTAEFEIMQRPVTDLQKKERKPRKAKVEKVFVIKKK